MTPAAKVPTEAEKASRKARVAAAKDALHRSVDLKGDGVVKAREALKTYLRNLNEARQPDDAAFTALLEAPFRPPRQRPMGR